MKRYRNKAIAAAFLLTVSLALHQHFQSKTMDRALLAMMARSHSLSERLTALETETAAAVEEMRLLNEEAKKWEDHREELMKLRDTVSRHHTVSYVSTVHGTDDKSLWLRPAAKAWTDKLARLKQEFSQSVELQIPEMELVTTQDWLNVTKTDMETDEDYLMALGKIREIGERNTFSLLNDAMADYTKANGNAFPTDLGQLRLYLKSPLSQYILDRWGIFPTTNFPAIPARGEFVITQKYPGTTKYDRRFYFNEQSKGSFP